jgi:D-hexose-6-phosphate mutarotase
MPNITLTEKLHRHEIPGHVSCSAGGGGLPKVSINTAASTAEVYVHGAHVTGFQKTGEAPLLFLSESSLFAADKPIRGGVPVCFPWFGPRENDVMHGFARLTNWELQAATKLPDGGVTLRFQMPKTAAGAAWPPFEAQYVVTVAEALTLELIVTNASAEREFSFENCLHTYFSVGDIAQVSITGLKGVSYLDKVEQFARKKETAEAIRISSEVDRVYLDTTSTVEIHDGKLARGIRIEKSGSSSTVVWNPWVTKAKAMTDFGDDEFKRMVCVESGNVMAGKLTLAPGQSSALKVVISSSPT